MLVHHRSITTCPQTFSSSRGHYHPELCLEHHYWLLLSPSPIQHPTQPIPRPFQPDFLSSSQIQPSPSCSPHCHYLTGGSPPFCTLVVANNLITSASASLSPTRLEPKWALAEIQILSHWSLILNLAKASWLPGRWSPNSSVWPKRSFMWDTN